MATTATYTPVIGDFSAAAFDLQSGDTSVVPRDPAVNMQDNPRSGFMRWFFYLNITDPTAGTDDLYNLKLPVRAFPPNVVTEKLDNLSINALFPIVTMTPFNLAAVAMPTYVDLTGFSQADDVGYVTMRLNITSATANAVAFAVNVDFVHSLPA